MDSKSETELHKFFDLDPFINYEVAYLTKEEEALRRHKPAPKSNNIPLTPRTEANDDGDIEYVPVYVRKTTISNVPPKVIRTNKPKHLMNA